MVKLSPAGTGPNDLLYATFLGGNDNDCHYSLCELSLDGAGNVYVAGGTWSVDFRVTSDALDPDYDANSNGDGFVVKLNPAGNGLNDLRYATFLGGLSTDCLEDCAIVVDGGGNAYVTGYTHSDDFPTTPNAYDTFYDNDAAEEIFVTKLALGDASLPYSITGSVRDSNSTPISGTLISLTSNLTNTASFTTLVNTTGLYTLPGLISGTYTITPTKAGYLFAPPTSTVTVPPSITGLHFTGTLQAMTVDILDPQDTPVTDTLILNNEGWPTPNPLTVQMTITNTSGATLTNPILTLRIDSSLQPSGQGGRFYVLETNGFDEGIYNSLEAQYEVITNTQAVNINQTRILTAQVWVQPSVTTTLSITTALYQDFDSWSQDDPLGQARAQVNVPQAKIHPVVIVPGYVATWPPEHGGDLDPLQKTYDNLVEALQRTGYELGDAGSGATLVPFGWDWTAPFGDTGRNTLEADIDSIRDIANHTKSYVDYEQVDIIAHSAGGLVARAFIEDSTINNQTKVNSLITLGTPHRGTPAAYRGGRGGQYDAIFPGNPQIATGVVAGLITCNEGFLAGSNALLFGRAEKIVLDEEELYEFVNNNISSTEDLLPTNDVTPTYIVDVTNPSINYPYGNPAGTPPDNPFLEDMGTSGGDYDISKLLVPDIISIFSPDFLPDLAEGTYGVDAPPYGQGDNVIWGHGKVISITQVPGDGLIPAYSANLTQLSPLSGASNITAFNANNIHHMSLPADSVMIRQLISFVTGIDVINNATLWTKAVPQPLVLTIAGQTIPYEAIYELVTCSPIRTLVTDPLGRQAGLDPDTGAIINEIPGAIVTKDGDEPHLIMVPRIQGQYQIKAVGIDNGDYTLGAFDIFSGTIQITGRIFTGTTTVGQSLQVSFDSSVFQEENGQVVMEAEHFNWQIGEGNQAWITQTTQAGYVGSGYLGALPDVDRIYTTAITSTSPQLEYTINFTTTGTYYVWIRGYAPNGAGDSAYVSLDDQSPVILTALPPQQWAWANTTGQGQRLTVEVTEPGEHTLFLWQREDGLKIDRFVLTVDDSYNPQGNGPNESPRIGVD